MGLLLCGTMGAMKADRPPDSHLGREVSKMIGWIGQNMGMLAGILGGAGGIAAFFKSFRIVREYERGVVTRWSKVVRDPNAGPNSDGAMEYTGFVFRLVGAYRIEVLNIEERNDSITLEGIERRTATGDREKWQLSATIKSRVTPGYVYSATVWKLDDIGEFARGAISGAIQSYLENTPVDNCFQSDQIFERCEEEARTKLLEHGITWTRLMVNHFARSDAEIQGQAIKAAAQLFKQDPSIPTI